MNGENEEDLLGPGSDLAISLSGILIVILVVSITLVVVRSPDQDVEAEKYDEMVKTASALIRERDQLKQDILTKDNHISKLAEQLKQSADDLSRIVFELTRERDKLEKEKLSQDQKLSQLEKRLKQLSDDISQDVSALTRERNELRQEKLSKDQLISELEKRQIQSTIRFSRQYQLAENRSKEISKLLSENDELGATSRRAEHTITELRDAILALNSRITELAVNASDKPPIITSSDAEVHTFRSASAEISRVLRTKLRDEIAPELRRLATRYNARIIEVVGHTDEVKIGAGLRRKCNVDKALLDVLNGAKQIQDLYVCDNVGLGMARAVAVVLELKKLGIGQGGEFILRPMSAGQTTLIDESLALGYSSKIDEPKRRRIEIRLRRSNR